MAIEIYDNSTLKEFHYLYYLQNPVFKYLSNKETKMISIAPIWYKTLNYLYFHCEKYRSSACERFINQLSIDI